MQLSTVYIYVGLLIVYKNRTTIFHRLWHSVYNSM